MRRAINGLVIKERAVGESDKILTVLTAELGKITISAKGVRSIKSKNMAVCRMFGYSNLEFYEKNGLRWLAGGSLIDSFYGLNTDMEGFALGAYILSIVDEISDENASDDTLLRATLNTLYAIEKKLRPNEQIKGAFEFFAASHSGFTPDMSQCSLCGRESSDGEFCLDIMNGALLCSACLSGRQKEYHAKGMDEPPQTDRYSTRNILIPLSKEVVLAIKYVLCAPVNRLFSFTLKEKYDQELLSRAGEAYIKNHLERSFDTLDFYHTICTPTKDI